MSDSSASAAVALELAVEQWSALAAREEGDAYRAGPPRSSPSSLPPVPSLAGSLDQWPQRQDGPASAAANEADHGGHGHGHGTVCPPAWREKICEWCFQVVDHCDIDRDVVSVALSYFDRYVSRHGSSIAEALYQLVAMTSLYVAVKVHSTKKISAASMSSLSKGHFRTDQILKMETCLLRALRWRLNPPTPAMYLSVAEPLLGACTDDDVHASYEISELSRYLLELSVCDGYFARMRPSSLAYGSIAVAMEVLNVPHKARESFGAYQLENSRAATEQCALRLRSVYHLAVGNAGAEDDRAGASPTTVFGHIG